MKLTYRDAMNLLPASERMILRYTLEEMFFGKEDHVAFAKAYYADLSLPHTWGAARCRVFWDDNKQFLKDYSTQVKVYLEVECPKLERIAEELKIEKHKAFVEWESTLVDLKADTEYQLRDLPF